MIAAVGCFLNLPQIVYVARDAKDVAVSYYHHYRLFFGYTGSCQDFIEAFLAEIGTSLDFGFRSSPISITLKLQDCWCLDSG
jgi:hypothetical protein